MRKTPQRGMDRLWVVIAVGLIGALLLVSAAPLTAGATTPATGSSPHDTPLPPASLRSAPRSAIPQLAGGPGNPGPGAPYSGPIGVFVAFAFSNQSRLNALLQSIANVSVGSKRPYVSAAGFDAQFGANPSAYRAAATYFGSFPGVNVTTYADRSGIFLSGAATTIGAAFGVPIRQYASPVRGEYYAAAGTPTLPQPIASSVIQVIGLSDYVTYHSDVASVKNLGPVTSSARVQGYPTPNEMGGVQYLYGSDMQVAYDEQALLNITDPSGEVVATILWAGCSTNTTTCPAQNLTAPFDPSDIYSYFNQTIPAGQPHPTVYGVPFDGAPPPGPSAASDQSGAVVENTLDLEMVGSTAPGAQIYNVYGVSPGSSETDAAMAYILNPPPGSPLASVQVISNSWGGPDHVDFAWNQAMEEAAARGITVLASTGDSGDNSESSSYVGTTVEFPSTVAYDAYGVVAVGGTTLALNLRHGASYLHIFNQTAWYNVNAAGGTDVLGSTGGTSSYYGEPSWQANSEANSYIDTYASQHEATSGQRGVPDLAAVANNTYIFYPGPNGAITQGAVAGTSVAAPITAGLFAEIDAVLMKFGQSPLGFADPAVYQWANAYGLAPPKGSGTQAVGTVSVGSWTSELPSSPVSFVTSGSNLVYRAQAGYSLVTGWGSLDAYNFTTYVLAYNYSGSGFALDGVAAHLNLTDLTVHSVGGSYSASVQLNAVIANSLGAPLYWVQNVIYLNATSFGSWAANYTGWVSYPYFGLYPGQTVYTYNFPLKGTTISTPVSWTIALSLSGSGSGRTLNFEVNNNLLQLPVPGAAFIISGYNYEYFWQGQQYTNGPFALSGGGSSGGLDPQFALVGGPSRGTGIFGGPTTGMLTLSVQDTGSLSFRPAIGAVAIVGEVSQTGETAQNLTWSGSGPNWNVSYANGSIAQGVALYSVLDAGNPGLVGPAHYAVNFTESGLPANASWSVALAAASAPAPITCVVGATSAGCHGTTISIAVTNGTFYFDAWTFSNYLPHVGSGTVSVRGAAQTITIDFAPPASGSYVISFEEVGLPRGTSWTIMTTGSAGSETGASQGPVVQFGLATGSYRYSVNSTAGYSASPSSGRFTVANTTEVLTISFFAAGASGTSFFDLSTFCAFGVCGPTLIYILFAIAILAGTIAIVGANISRRAERRERAAREAHGAVRGWAGTAWANAEAPTPWSPPGIPPTAAAPPSGDPSTSGSAQPGQPSHDPEGTLRCRTCGTPIPESARYCPSCGAAAPPSLPPSR